jgi:hypothetical protein
MSKQINATDYSAVTAAVTAAVRNELSGVNKWQIAGAAVAAFYGSESALDEVKAQFIADGILPALDKRHTAALEKELARKGSEEYNKLDANGRELWEKATQAKKDARATAHTMFSRIVKYAFPKEKAETVARTLETRMAEELASLIKACEKAETPAFDPAKVIKHLKSALAIVSAKPAN